MITTILKFIGKYWYRIDIYVFAVIVYFAIYIPDQKRQQNNFDKVVYIASQPRYSISNDFEKMRTKDNAPINLNLSNELQDNHIEVSDSTIKKEAKKGLFRRIFKKKS